MTLTMQSHDTKIEAATEVLKQMIKAFSFYPANSLIIRWMRSGEVVLTQRADVDAFLEPGALDESEVALFVEPGKSYLAEQALIVVCMNEMDNTIQQGIAAMESALNNAEIALVEAFVIVGQRMHSQECDENCDPHVTVFGSEFPTGSNDRAARAQACRSDNAQLIDAELFPHEPEEQVITEWRSAESEFARQLFIGDQGPISNSDCARLAVAMADLRVRDSILWDMAHEVFNLEHAAQLLTGLLPRLDTPRGAPVATSAAICWWLQGNGAIANMCIDRAFLDSPGYSLATMVRAALDYALPPTFWIESVNALTRKQCLAGIDPE